MYLASAFHARKARAASDEKTLRAVVKAFLKPLRERRAACTEPGELNVPAAAAGPKTFHAWLSAKPGKDRHRPISKSRRSLDGVSKWPSWLSQEERSGLLRTCGGSCEQRARRAPGQCIHEGRGSSP